MEIRKHKEFRIELSTYKGQGFFNIAFYLPFIIFKWQFYNSNYSEWFEFSKGFLSSRFCFVFGIDLNWIRFFKIHFIHSIQTIDLSVLFIHIKISWFNTKLPL